MSEDRTQDGLKDGLSDAAPDAESGAGDAGRARGDGFGRLLRRLRVGRGWSQAALAKRVGCARSYVCAIEGGTRQAPVGARLRALAEAFGPDGPALSEAAWWARTPAPIRARLTPEGGDAGLRALGGVGPDGAWRTGLDQAFRSGTLNAMLGTDPGGATASAACGTAPRPGARGRARPIPVINRVSAGVPSGYTDLGYPAHAADEYVHCPGVDDPDAFAATVTGDSMEPEYREGDVVVFSPSATIPDGSDCFVRLEPDAESTFKRVYFEGDGAGASIRLQPLNDRYPVRTLSRESVGGLSLAVTVIRPIRPIQMPETGETGGPGGPRA